MWSPSPGAVSLSGRRGWWVSPPAVVSLPRDPWTVSTQYLQAPPAMTAAAAMHVPVVAAGATVTVPVMTATAATGTPSFGVSISAPVMSASATLPTPTVTAGHVLAVPAMAGSAAMGTAGYDITYNRGNFPYTFDWQLDGEVVSNTSFDYTFSFGLG